MNRLDHILNGGWRTVMDFNGARFLQNVNEPEVYMRLRRRDDGSVETRYAWDGDGLVTPSIGDIARNMNGDTPRETPNMNELADMAELP